MMTEIVWGLITAVDLLMIGSAGGAAIAAGLAYLFGKGKFSSLAEAGSYIAPIFGILSIVTVILDLGRFTTAPGNILYTFSNYPDSMITVGTVLRVIFIVMSLFNALVWIFSGDGVGSRGARKVLGGVNVLLGFSVTLYPGFMLALARGVPLWSSPVFPWVLAMSSVLNGLVISALAVPIIGSLMPRLSNNLAEAGSALTGELSKRLSLYSGIVTVVELILVALYMSNVSGVPGYGSLMSSLVFWGGFVIVGLVLPLIIYVIGWLDVGLSGSLKTSVLYASFLLVIIGSLAGRYALLLAAQL